MTPAKQRLRIALLMVAAFALVTLVSLAYGDTDIAAVAMMCFAGFLGIAITMLVAVRKGY